MIDKLTTDTLDLLAQLRADIADGKVRVSGYNIERQYARFTYSVKVEEVKENSDGH